MSTVFLAACAPQADDSDPFVVADVFATQGKALATIELSPTPEPTATATSQIPVVATVPPPTLPLPTVVVLRPTMPISTPGPTPTRPIDVAPGLITGTPGEVAACSAPSPPFDTTWEALNEEARTLLGCPTSNPYVVHGVYQTFEHGAMFWRESSGYIFVLSEIAIEQGQATDSWWRFGDSFQEGDPESDPDIQAPEGLLQPVRGFGGVWRNNGFVRDALGWASSPETAIDSVWADFEGGWMMTGPDGSPVFALIPLDAARSTGLHFGYLP